MVFTREKGIYAQKGKEKAGAIKRKGKGRRRSQEESRRGSQEESGGAQEEGADWNQNQEDRVQEDHPELTGRGVSPAVCVLPLDTTSHTHTGKTLFNSVM